MWGGWGLIRKKDLKVYALAKFTPFSSTKFLRNPSKSNLIK
jgi:hypothetical protein